MDDLELLRAYVDDGDLAALSALVHKHRRSVLATCWRKLGSYTDAEDATQEVFLALMEQASQVRINVGAWLHRCAVNIANSTLRARRRAVRRDQEKGRLDSTAVTPGDALLLERIAILDQFLGELDSGDHQILLQNCLEGSTQEEIAEELGVSQQTVSKRLSRIVAGLRWGLRRHGVVAPVAVMLALAVRRMAYAAVPQRVMSLLAGAPGASGGGEPVVKIAASLKVAAATFIVVSALVMEEDQSNGPSPSPTGARVAAVLPEESAFTMARAGNAAAAVASGSALDSAWMSGGSPALSGGPAGIVRISAPQVQGAAQVGGVPPLRPMAPVAGMNHHAGIESMSATPLMASVNPSVSKDWPLDIGGGSRIIAAKVSAETRTPAKPAPAGTGQNAGQSQGTSPGQGPPAGDDVQGNSMPMRFAFGGGELAKAGEGAPAMRQLTMGGGGEEEAGRTGAHEDERMTPSGSGAREHVDEGDSNGRSVVGASGGSASTSPAVRDRVIPIITAATGQTVVGADDSEAGSPSALAQDAGYQPLPRLWPYASAGQAAPLVDTRTMAEDEDRSQVVVNQVLVNRVVPLGYHIVPAPEPGSALLLAPACMLLLRRAKRQARRAPQSV